MRTLDISGTRAFEPRSLDEATRALELALEGITVRVYGAHDNWHLFLKNRREAQGWQLFEVSLPTFILADLADVNWHDALARLPL